MKDQSIDSGRIQLKESTPQKTTFTQSLFKTDVVFVDQNMPLIEVAKLMRDRGIGDVIVTQPIDEKLKPVGIITDRDLVVRVIAEKKSAETMRASDVMMTPVTVAYEKDGVYDLIRVMKKEGIGRLPIVDERGSLVGIVTAKKLLQLLAQEFTDLIQFSRKSLRKDLTIQH